MANYQDNVIQLFNRSKWSPAKQDQLIRLSPELDGLEMLYANDHNEVPVGLKILCWGINQQGEVDALVPWLDKVHHARFLKDPLSGRWVGYFNQQKLHTFLEPPEHKIKELQSASKYFSQTCDEHDVVQEIPDNIGTSALIFDEITKAMTLYPVISWQLTRDGLLKAMVAPSNLKRETLLPGDSALIAVEELPGFQYFFHHVVANQIKKKEPKMMKMLALLEQLKKS